MTKDEGLERVKELIEQFENRRKEWRSVSYKEASVRIDFIDEFFLALGWRKGTGEFKVEKSQDLENENKGSADYYFDLGAGKRFFVEAKKPSENLAEKTKHALQARRYAYSAGHPVVILTDFEEFYVYKGRGVAPKENDDAKVAIINELSCKDFTEYPAKWDVLWNAFSRESVLAGSLETLPGVIADKRGSMPVDRLFLSDIEKWRSLLAENIHKNNPDQNRRALNEAVQKTIDRIIFLRICEDRDIEEYGHLLNAGKAPEVYKQLCVLFKQADTRFNSGLFHFKKEKNRDDFDDISLNLIIENEPLQTIIDRLYWPGGPYAFAAMPADILGQVYERFLGKVIEIDGESITVDDKPEVKKAGGVFYTPEYIVDYIVKNTVGRLLDACKTPSDGANLKILDPACGSGAFLINAYQYLLNWHLGWYSANKPEAHAKERRILKNVHGAWQLTLAERKRILLNNIHGVDIDSQAVEVTKLSLLLKCVEGETRTTTQMGLFDKGERILPDLENNIKCGNSLIGSDFYDNVQGELFDTEEKLKINAFDWNDEFKEIMNRGGFDCIIGNPPYVRSISLKENNPTSWEYYRTSYRSTESREWDIYLIFVEKALGLLKENGKLGYILPNKFLNSQVGENLRGMLSHGSHLESLIHFGAFQIFSGATTYTCLLFLSKTAIKQAQIARYTGSVTQQHQSCPLPEQAPEQWHKRDVSSDSLTSASWEFSASEAVLLKLRKWPKLGDLSLIFKGTGTNADKVYMLEKRGFENGHVRVFSAERNEEYLLEPTYLKPALRGRSIGRYDLTGLNLLLLVPYEQQDGKYRLVSQEKLQACAPNTLAYLEDCQERLDEREKGRFVGEGFYCFGRPQNMERFEVAEKIIMPDVVNRGTCALDTQKHWLLDTCYAITLKPDTNLDQNYILAILNSALLTCFLKETGTALRGGYFRMKTAYLTPFPIRTINFDDSTEKQMHDDMVKLVTDMLKYQKELQQPGLDSQTKKQHQKDIATTDRKIDELVYRLYDLTPDEIRIVEEARP